MKKGFTLVELIAVIAILGILVLLVAPNVIGMFSRGVSDTMKIQETNVLDAAKLYIEDFCRNPIDKSRLSSCNTSRMELFLFGDVNNDGQNDILDLTKFRKQIAGQNSISSELIERADLDLNGKLDSDDLEIFRKYLAGISVDEIYPEKVYFCINTIRNAGYLTDEIKYKESSTCGGFVAFTKVGKAYSNGKTYLKCGDDEYTTIDYSVANNSKFKDAMEVCY